jgi:hypothetical protein
MKIRGLDLCRFRYRLDYPLQPQSLQPPDESPLEMLRVLPVEVVPTELLIASMPL